MVLWQGGAAKSTRGLCTFDLQLPCIICHPSQVVYGGAPCCRQHGDEVELTADVFQRVAAEWHICVPEVDASCTRGGDITVTLYLIPDNHSGIQYPGYPDYDVVDMGMSHIHASVNASQLVDELVDRVGYLAYGDHLHVVILADSLRLRPAAGQPGSCRCDQGCCLPLNLPSPVLYVNVYFP